MLTFAKKARIGDAKYLETKRHDRCAGASLLGCYGDLLAAHLRFSTDGGTSLKPSDCFTSTLCYGHHHSQHQRGEAEFWTCVFNEDTEQLMERLSKAMLWDYAAYLFREGRAGELPALFKGFVK